MLGGSLGDWLVHCLGPANLALKLSEAPPISVECVEVKGVSKWTWPTNSRLRYEFPAREGLPPVKMTWYDGGKKPAFLAERKIRRDDYELTVRITRTGHVISWANAA